MASTCHTNHQSLITNHLLILPAEAFHKADSGSQRELDIVNLDKFVRMMA